MENETLKPFISEDEKQPKPKSRSASKPRAKTKKAKKVSSGGDFFKIYSGVQGIVIIALLFQILTLREQVANHESKVASLEESIQVANGKIESFELEKMRISMLNKDLKSVANKVTSLESDFMNIGASQPMFLSDQMKGLLPQSEGTGDINVSE